MELALNWAVEQKPKLIRIFGATGGRMDHIFANVQLLVNPLWNNEISNRIIDHQNIVSIKSSWNLSIDKMKHKKYISFIPITLEVKGLT